MDGGGRVRRCQSVPWGGVWQFGFSGLRVSRQNWSATAIVKFQMRWTKNGKWPRLKIRVRGGSLSKTGFLTVKFRFFGESLREPKFLNPKIPQCLIWFNELFRKVPNTSNQIRILSLRPFFLPKIRRMTAGEIFFAWIKNCKPMPAAGCLKKIILHKTPVKSGENAFRRKAFSGWHHRC
jgi:hypothetical protein